jgi:tRNA U34 5-methylaminomethyl-2-thiouridine-forming methyltransferase MnmC
MATQDCFPQDIPQSGWVPELTADGSFTFFSDQFGESFHSRQGAREEAVFKFVTATDLAQKATQSTLCLLDVCYGLGYNTAAALETIWNINPGCVVQMVGLELDATVPRAAIAPPLINVWAPLVQTILTDLANRHAAVTPQLKARLLMGDARHTIAPLIESRFQADAIFFDPFSPRRCPQLWTVEFFQQVAQCLSPTGKLATYSRAASVRSALLAAGLKVGTIPLQGQTQAHEWSQGTVAAFTADTLYPLSLLEQEHLHTRAAIPYRDPTLQDTAAVILARHAQEQHQSQLESTSSWRRRWKIH